MTGKTNKIQFIKSVLPFLFLVLTISQNALAQRFGHGGGGGSFRGGNGGGNMRHPTQAPEPRNFNNGGNRNFSHQENHMQENRGQENRHEYHFDNIQHNEHAYHHFNGQLGYGHHEYSYHPYHPYVWGPHWHPFGFFITAMAADAFFFSLNNQNYYYDNGVYYQPYGTGYAAVLPPIGAVVNYLPAGYEIIQVGDASYFYYGGVFYLSQGGSFRVSQAPLGAIVNEIPEGATQQNFNDNNFLYYNNTYYQPISQDGQDAYEVVQVN